MFSDSPAIPGRSAQTPRTMRSIFTPACDASYSASMVSGSSSAFILAMIRAGLPSRASAVSLPDRLEDALVQGERRLPQIVQPPGAAEAGELVEDLVHVGAKSARRR